MRRSSVDLPHPDGPISDTNSPARTVSDTSTSASTARLLPALNTLLAPRTVTASRRAAPSVPTSTAAALGHHASSGRTRLCMIWWSARVTSPAITRPSAAAPNTAV